MFDLFGIFQGMARRRLNLPEDEAPEKAARAEAKAVERPMWSLHDLFPAVEAIDVLDVGAAYSERPPYQSLVEAGRARITGFEPNVRECERLAREYGDPHRFFPFFVGDGRPATFHETSDPLTGSLFEPNSPLLERFQALSEFVKPVAEHRVETRRIDDIAGLENVDYFKIDVQGSELAIFGGAQRALAGTLVIQTEVEFVELYKGQPLFADVDAFLRQAGFQFLAFESTHGRSFKPLVCDGDLARPFRQVLWADAVYVRDWMKIDRLPEVKLQKLALLAHDLLMAYDLALLALAEIDRRAGSNMARAYSDRLAEGPITIRC